jgi:MutS domain V
MKANLMYVDRDVDLACELPTNTAALTQDLGLDVLCGAMAQGDRLVFEISKRALLLGLTDISTIAYRQAILADCVQHPMVVREIYRLATEAVEAERKIWGLYSGAPQSILSRALNAAELLLGYLRRLSQVGEEHAADFSSDGFSRFFRMVSTELTEEYFRDIETHLRQLRFRQGTLISANLGEGNTATGLVLRRPRARRLTDRLSALTRSGYSFEISARDDAGLRVLGDLQARGINMVANALAQSAEHIRSFFTMLRTELAFYVGCVNLRDQLSDRDETICVPQARPIEELALAADGLYDVCLPLRADGAVVGNDLTADGKSLVMITGANQGGKSTFLRGVGLAQMMMQCGMFVAAVNFEANVCCGIFTHFKREEDPTMKSGKFDEELRRMSEIAAKIAPGCLLLCNESFASTNEREGSEIGREVVKAMTELRVKIIFVTHMFELADDLYSDHQPTSLFLRAERLPDGRRTFKLIEGEPLSTSFGQDSYHRVFGQETFNAQMSENRQSP